MEIRYPSTSLTSMRFEKIDPSCFMSHEASVVALFFVSFAFNVCWWNICESADLGTVSSTPGIGSANKYSSIILKRSGLSPKFIIKVTRTSENLPWHIYGLNMPLQTFFWQGRKIFYKFLLLISKLTNFSMSASEATKSSADVRSHFECCELFLPQRIEFVRYGPKRRP